jgi:hypothetical protein
MFVKASAEGPAVIVIAAGFMIGVTATGIKAAAMTNYLIAAVMMVCGQKRSGDGSGPDQYTCNNQDEPCLLSHIALPVR